MTITVTPQPTNSPPRVRIDLSTDDPAKSFTTLTLYRGGKKLRSQPYVGAGAAVVFDYEAPFGVAADYSGLGSTATYSVLRDETWSSLSGWTTENGAPSVTGGRFSEGLVSRDIAFPDSWRLECEGLTPSVTITPPWNIGFAAIDLGGLSIENMQFGGEVAFAGGLPRTIGGLGSPFTVTRDGRFATVATTAGTWVLEADAGFSMSNRLQVNVSGSGSYVKKFTISTGENASFSAAATAILDVDEAWLIHPSHPALSISIDPGQHKFRDAGVNVDASTKASKTRAARATRHDPYGRERPIVITSGPRAAPEWDLRLRTRTLEARDTVEAIIRDQSVLLLRSPQGWPWDLPDGWYSVGDYAEDRPRETRLDAPDRVLSLPLTEVDEPIVRQGALWTYGADMLANATYSTSRAQFPTYLDRFAGPVS